jgi:hypothetical protein
LECNPAKVNAQNAAIPVHFIPHEFFNLQTNFSKRIAAVVLFILA